MSFLKVSTELKKTIPWSLVLIFIIFTTGLILSGRLFYTSQKARIYKEQENNLSAIASLKIGQIQQWHTERLGDASVISDNEPIIRRIKQYFRGENHFEIVGELNKWMLSLNNTDNYRSIMLLDTAMKVRFSTSDSVPDNIGPEELTESIRNQRIIMTDFCGEEKVNYIHIDIIVPLKDPDSKKPLLSGLVILRIDPWKKLFPLIQSWPTPSKSSETLLLRKDGDSVLFLNELRHKKNTALNLRLPVSNYNLLASKAVRGVNGIVEGVDYRNLPVVGYTAGIPGLPWFMVAKTDKEELNVPIRRYLYISVFLTILLVLINGSFFGFWIWNQRMQFYRLQLKNELDRKKAEEDLSESEERFSKAYKTSPISFMIANMDDGRIIEVNDAFTSISGFTREEVFGSTTLNLNIWVHEEDRQNMITILSTGRSLVRKETLLRSKSGKIITTLLSAQAIQLSHRNCIISSIEDITERKRAEEILLNSELRLQKAQSIAHVGNWELDLSTKTITASDEAFRIYGLSIENREIPLEKVQNIPLPEYRAALNEALDRLLKYNETYEAEFQIINAENGAIKWIYSKAELYNVIDSEQVKVIGVIQDITDRKKAEETVRESENKYRNIFENVQDLYFETLFDGTIIDLSPSIISLSREQYKREDLIGKSMYSFYAEPEKRPVLLSTIKEQGYINDYEIILKNRDSSIIPCSLSARISFDARGNPDKIIGSMRDISARKEFEEMLKQERNLLRTLVDNIPDPVSIKNSDCRYILNNKAHLRVIGVSNQEDASGKTSFDFYRNEEASEFYSEDENIISTGSKMINKLERVISKSTNVESWYLTSKIPLTDNNGKPTHVLTVSHDITDRKIAEEELIKAKEKAEESDRLKTAFLHNISHEIRTPMNAIVGFSALLGEPDLDVHTKQSYIETIMQSSNHLLSIITDILNISNIEANVVKIARNEINVNFTLNLLHDQFLLKAGEKKIKLICETQLSDSEAMVITDNTKLTQVLANLIGNAIKFTDKGFVKVVCKKADNFLEFSVSDSGIGIQTQFQSKVFDRFYQVQSAGTRLYEGTGLGLSISKAYVDLLGGMIWLASEHGKGTTFCFTVPYERQSIVPLQDIEKSGYEGFIFTKKRTILIAEDIDSNFKLISYFLSRSNTKLLRAFNGKEAVEIALGEKDIDLILMDIKMPEMDGYTAAKLIREANITIPIIAQTAYADEKESAFENGCNAFISKPFDKKHLIKVLSEFI